MNDIDLPLLVPLSTGGITVQVPVIYSIPIVTITVRVAYNDFKKFERSKNQCERALRIKNELRTSEK